MTPILQSDAWAGFQRALGKRVHQGQGPDWSFLAVEEKTPLGRYLYVPYGPTAGTGQALDAALAALTALARRVKADYVRVEPVDAGLPAAEQAAQEALAKRGLRHAPADIQPHLTRKIDLRQDTAELLAAMRSTNRNLYRNIGKKGVSFDVSTDPADLPILLDFLHKVSGRAEFKAQSDDYLTQAARTLMPAGAAKLFLARVGGTPIAAALSYDTPDTRVYAHAAADDAYRKLNAGVPLLVTMILDAKDSGRESFDLWGVSPEDEPDHSWAGFSRFKRSFGGYDVAYPGTWDLPVNKASYAAYGAARKARTLLRSVLRTARTTARSVRR